MITVHASISCGVFPPPEGQIRPHWYRFKNVDRAKLNRICEALALKRNKLIPGKSIIVVDSESGEEVAFVHGEYFEHDNKRILPKCSYTIYANRGKL